MEVLMKNTSKSRNREHRTKPSRETVSMPVKVSRAVFEQVKAIESRTALTREEIFLKGLYLCNDQ